MRLVLDTNVLVSALLTPDGVCARCLDRVQTGGHELLFDHRIRDEYARVLARHEFGFRAATVADLIAAVGAVGLLIDADPIPVGLPDPDDLPFLEVAQSGRSHALVTGSRRHFIPLDGTHGVRVITLREALELL